MNVLQAALSVQPKQCVNYHRFTSRLTNEIGLDNPAYARGTPIYGSFQPVPRNLYQTYGLDFNNNYATFYTLTSMIDIQRDVSADQITFGGKRFQVLNANDWFAVNGWQGVLVVQIEGKNV